MGPLLIEMYYWQYVYHNKELRSKYIARVIVSIAVFIVTCTLISIAYLALADKSLTAVVLLFVAFVQVIKEIYYLLGRLENVDGDHDGVFEAAPATYIVQKLPVLHLAPSPPALAEPVPGLATGVRPPPADCLQLQFCSGAHSQW